MEKKGEKELFKELGYSNYLQAKFLAESAVQAASKIAPTEVSSAFPVLKVHKSEDWKQSLALVRNYLASKQMNETLKILEISGVQVKDGEDIQKICSDLVLPSDQDPLGDVYRTQMIRSLLSPEQTGRDVVLHFSRKYL
jgi:hypothetical protein